MKKEKQLRVLLNLRVGFYSVREDRIYSHLMGFPKELKPNRLPSGYMQYILNPNRPEFKVIAYCHQIVYLANYGEYDETFIINHKDRNRLNNLPYNLEAKSHKGNSENSIGRQPTKTGLRLIRANEIKQIKNLISENHSQSYIARRLNLNRLSVRYIIKRIENGFKLKYEN